MKKIIIIFLLLMGAKTFAAENLVTLFTPQPDSILIEYSLFSEYHKNKDYKSALPHGWKVLSMDPDKFSKWIYAKMEDILWYQHDSTEVTEEQALAIADTVIYIYDMAMQHNEVNKPYWQLRKAMVTDLWKKSDPEMIIAEYEKAAEFDSTLSSYYFNRLGLQYQKLIESDPDYKMKALNLYTMLAEREPDNPQWNSILEGLVDSIEELVELARKSWDQAPDDLAKGWKYASLALRAEDYVQAQSALEKLTEMAPETVNYWKQLATVYHKTNQLDKAESAYKTLQEIDPDGREHYLNLGIIYKDQNNFSQARAQFQKASEVGDGWGLPIYYIGTLYESAARGCGFEFMDKVVYLLAQQTYRQAYSMDNSLTMARDRVNALSQSVPTQEDYFFRKLNSGSTIKIEGNCYGWIGRTVTVP